MQISLTASDTTLAGSATYTMTGGTGGTANVTGYVFWQDSATVPSGRMMPAHSVVVLHFAFSDGRSARFDQAVLRGQDTLSGALTFDDQPSSSYGATFTRTLVAVSATQTGLVTLQSVLAKPETTRTVRSVAVAHGFDRFR